MSYRCGIGGRLGRAFGVGSSEPVIICDGCGIERPVASKTHFAPSWFLDGKPPPKWRGRRWTDDDGNVRREDWCPGCKDKARRERDEARAALATCPDCVMYAKRSARFAEQADQLQRERDEARAEVERLKREVSDAQIALKAQEHRDQWLMAQSVGYGFYKRGAEAMRDRCAQWIRHKAGDDRIAWQVERLPIPEDK